MRIGKIDDAEDDSFRRQLLQHFQVELGLRRLDRDLRGARAFEFAQERVAGRFLVHDRCIAEAQMHCDRAGDAVERAVERLQAVFARLVRMLLHPRLVDLHDVGACREQILDLVVNRGGIVERHFLLACVEFVLRLLRHGEGSGHRHLHGPLRIGAQELQVAQLDRIFAEDFAGDARHRDRLARAVDGGAGIVSVDAFERRGEAVGIAFAPLLAVRNDVEASALLLADRQQRCFVLLGLQLFRVGQPEIVHAHARHHFRQPHAVDQPIRLRIGSDERGGKQLSGHGGFLFGEFGAHDLGAVDHGAHFPVGHIARQIFQPAVGRDHDFLRRHMRQRAADSRRDRLRRLHRHISKGRARRE